MPYRKNDPFPEHLEIEVNAFLPGLVHLWVPVAVLVIYILLERVGEEAGP